PPALVVPHSEPPAPPTSDASGALPSAAPFVPVRPPADTNESSVVSIEKIVPSPPVPPVEVVPHISPPASSHSAAFGALPTNIPVVRVNSTTFVSPPVVVSTRNAVPKSPSPPAR